MMIISQTMAMAFLILIHPIVGQIIIEADPKTMDLTTTMRIADVRSLPKAGNLTDKTKNPNLTRDDISIPFTRYENIPIGESVIMSCEAFNRYKYIKYKKSNDTMGMNRIFTHGDVIKPTDDDLEVKWILPSDHKAELLEVTWNCGDADDGNSQEDITFSQKLLSSGLTRFCVDKGISMDDRFNDTIYYGLRILQVKEDDSGIYLCAVRRKENGNYTQRATSQEWLYGKVALNLSPFRGNFRAKLEAKAIKAAWLAGSIGVLALILLGLEKYKYKGGPGHNNEKCQQGGRLGNNGASVAHHHLSGGGGAPYQYFQYGSTNTGGGESGIGIVKQPMPAGTNSSGPSFTNLGYEMAERDSGLERGTVDGDEAKM